MKQLLGSWKLLLAAFLAALAGAVGTVFAVRYFRPTPAEREARQRNRAWNRIEPELRNAVQQLRDTGNRQAASRVVRLALDAGRLGLAAVVAEAEGIENGRLENLIDFVRAGEQRLREDRLPDSKRALGLLEDSNELPLHNWLRFYVAQRYAAAGDWKSALNNFSLIRRLHGVSDGWVDYFELRAALENGSKETARELSGRLDNMPVEAPLVLKQRVRLTRIQVLAEFGESDAAWGRLTGMGGAEPGGMSLDLTGADRRTVERMHAATARRIAPKLENADRAARLWFTSAALDPEATAEDSEFSSFAAQAGKQLKIASHEMGPEPMINLARALATSGAAVREGIEGTLLYRVVNHLSVDPVASPQQAELTLSRMQLQGDPKPLVARLAARTAGELKRNRKRLELAERLFRMAQGMRTSGWREWAYDAVVTRRLQDLPIRERDAELLHEVARRQGDRVGAAALAEYLGWRAKTGASARQLMGDLANMPASQVKTAWKAALTGNRDDYTWGVISFYQLDPELEDFGWAGDTRGWEGIENTLNSRADRFAGWLLIDLARSSGSALTAVGEAAEVHIGDAHHPPAASPDGDLQSGISTRPGAAYLVGLRALCSPPEELAFAETAESSGVDAELLRAVALKESGFDADAVSSAGAVGVMQVMPGVARGLPGVYPAELSDPEVNLPAGAEVLLRSGYGREPLPQVLASYNWGTGRVDGYLQRLAPEDIHPLVWTESIPVVETEYFVKSVLAYRAVYRLIRDD